MGYDQYAVCNDCSCRTYICCYPLHSQTYEDMSVCHLPWVPEIFLVRFPVSVKSLRPKMCRPSANTENSHRAREKPLVPRVCVILSNFFEEQCTQSHPQLLSWLSRAPFSTTFLEIAVYMHVTSFHCKVVKLYVNCIWRDTPSAVRYEQMPKSRYYCL